EEKTIVEILDAIQDEAKKTFPHLLIDTSALKNQQFPVIDYCVQYGESTYDFMSRLMARFGIWYFFGHSATGGNLVLNETMFLKPGSDKQPPQAGSFDVDIKTTLRGHIPILGIPAGFQDDADPDDRQLAKVVRHFRPPERRVAIGAFSYLNPTNPFYKTGTVDPAFDLLKNEGGPPAQTKFSGVTRFAEPVFSDKDADERATVATAENESDVLLLSAITRNNTFVTGHSFHINKPNGFDANNNETTPFADIVDKKFVIESLAVTGNDYTYINLAGNTPVASDVINALLKTIASLQDATDDSDNAVYKASVWATVTARSRIYPAVNPVYGDLPDTAAGSGVAGALNTAAGALGGVLPGPFGGVISGLDFEGAVKGRQNMTTFAVGIIAVPLDPPPDMTLPLWGRPTARGPHTAVVIGPKGVDTKEHDIFCDAIGRVRVRFPWDPGPPEGGSKIPPVFPFAQSDKPTRVGENTGWVRVVEDWAGRHYGMQFLPRIGQEVLIDFLDGDPERPVITGRLYNADKGTTNLPFPDNSVKDTTIDKLSALPATQKFDLLLSGIKTWSIPTTDGSGNPLPARFHLLRFSDKRDHEQYLIRSQHRLDITAFHKRYESIHNDRHMTVGGKWTNPAPGGIVGDYIAHVFKDYHLHVGDAAHPTDSGNRITLIEQNDQNKVVKNADHAVGGNWSTSVGGQATLDANGIAGVIVLNATTNITLTVGGSSIVITPAAIAITSPMVLINSGGPPPLPPIDPNVPKPQDPTAADPGDTLTPPD
ncbi:MAG TPA: contractile injection system protein, VgrG/Pvc8 family, partial [Stellaceae bacterium]|nr:contractile injection system protein, VgrG/Pvc8 family [Stellaceae bacterium]